MSGTLPDCTALCERFKCERKPSAMKILRKKGQKVVWCTWVDDECDGAWCQFSICLDRKMANDGKCRRVKKPLIPDDDGLDEIEDPELVPKEYAKKIKKKGYS